MTAQVHVGFTGTEHGLTEQQMHVLPRAIRVLCTGGVLHHGDCIEGDAAAHRIALKEGIRVHLHPPSNPTKRAFCTGWTWCDEVLPYLERNHMIVRCSSRLIACPREDHEVVRSGVWATVRYARTTRRPVTIIFPEGEIWSDASR